MKRDDPVDDIRKTRLKISQKFDHDPQKIIKYYIKFQKKYQERLTHLAETDENVSEELA